jgi:oligopeptidase B
MMGGLSGNMNKVIVFFAFLILSITFVQGQKTFEAISPPRARIIPRVDTVHGDIRIDDYYWLRDRENPEVIEYLNAENKYTSAMMAPTIPLQNRLYREMLSRIRETDLSVPVQIDSYYYYSRTKEGKQYSVYCRKKNDLNASEQVLLDLNELAVGHSHMELGAYEVSPDHQYLAYSIDTAGSERYTLHVKDIDADTLYAERIENVGDQIAWANDNETFFYSVLDQAKRPYKLYRHVLRTDESSDRMVYYEKDEAFWIDILKTKSEKYIILLLGSHNTTENYYLSADEPQGQFTLVEPRESGVRYYIDHRGGTFYIRTDKGAQNFKVMVTAVDRPAAANWSEWLPQRDSVMIDDLDIFADHAAIYETENGLQKIHVIDLNDGLEHWIEFPEPTYAIFRTKNPEFNTDILRFEYTSLVTPRTVFDYNMVTRFKELKKQYEVVGGFDPAQYCSERIFAPAPDSTLVPISIVYRRDIKRDGRNPMLLTAYGAYGYSNEAYFSSNRLSLLNRGFIFAIAHVRGGGEMGEHWHLQGQFLNKKNTFTDFIACAEYLVVQKYTAKDLLAISGGSAGGTLIGAVVNMHPELFKAAIAEVPFVDVINTLLDPSIPLTVVEYTELGNPFEKKYYEYMRLYSPYDNVTAQDYPNMLVLASINDPRVGYWEPAKWTAKLRALKTDDNLLLLRTNMGAGHSGSSGRYDYLKDIAFEYAFILYIMGVTE